MKKASLILSFIALLCFANAQQNAPVASAKKANVTMKADAKPSHINAPVPNNAEPMKACCQGKTAAQCSHDAMAGETKPACCQKGGSCTHGTTEKTTEKKPQ